MLKKNKNIVIAGLVLVGFLLIYRIMTDEAYAILFKNIMNPAELIDVRVSVKVATDDPEIFNNTLAVLQKRFARVVPKKRINITSDIKEKTIVYDLKLKEPNRELLHFLVTAEGNLKCYLKNDPENIWFTSQDIDITEFKENKITTNLNLILSFKSEASNRVSKLSSDNIGELLLVQLDKEVLSVGELVGQVKEHIWLGSGVYSERQHEYMAAIIDSGLLPASVYDVESELVNYEHKTNN